jgi:hypothetical protein
MFGATVDDEIAGDMGQKYMVGKRSERSWLSCPVLSHIR